MSFVTFAQPGLLSPLLGLQGLFRWFAAGSDSKIKPGASTSPVSPATQTRSGATGFAANYSTSTGTSRVIRSPITPFGGSGNGAAVCTSQRPTGQVTRSVARPAARRVHISRLVEAGQAPTNMGRMVISGRMEDVCAELDRLVLREATLH